MPGYVKKQNSQSVGGMGVLLDKKKCKNNSQSTLPNLLTNSGSNTGSPRSTYITSNDKLFLCTTQKDTLLLKTSSMNNTSHNDLNVFWLERSKHFVKCTLLIKCAPCGGVSPWSRASALPPHLPQRSLRCERDFLCLLKTWKCNFSRGLYSSLLWNQPCSNLPPLI